MSAGIGQLTSPDAFLQDLYNRTSKGKVVRKTFDGAVDGAQGAVTLFTVSGAVRAKIVGFCTENMAGATATIEVGISGGTALIIALTTATDLIAGEIWHDASPDAEIEADSVAVPNIIADGNDVILTIATADLTNGTIVFVCEWEALTVGAKVEAA